MTYKRTVLTGALAFLVSVVLAVVVHGLILAADYAPFYGTLLRTGESPAWQASFLPVAHLSFVSALIWVYTRVPLEGSALIRGLKVGIVGWLMGPVPLFLRWSAEQPWPDNLVAKQLTLELLSSLVIGTTIAIVAGVRTARMRLD